MLRWRVTAAFQAGCWLYLSFDRNVDFIFGERNLQVLLCLVADLTARERMEFEQHKNIAITIIEGVEAGHLLEREMGVEVGKGAGVQIIPCGVPTGAIVCHFCGQVRERAAGGSEVVAEGGQVGGEGDLVAADGDQEPVAVGVGVDVAAELAGRVDECVLGWEA